MISIGNNNKLKNVFLRDEDNSSILNHYRYYSPAISVEHLKLKDILKKENLGKEFKFIISDKVSKFKHTIVQRGSHITYITSSYTVANRYITTKTKDYKVVLL